MKRKLIAGAVIAITWATVTGLLFVLGDCVGDLP